MHRGTTHIIGAGLAGLSAASELASSGQRVIVYEASSQAGGRCRSYHDAGFGAVIDNGNHLLLSGNEAAFSYLRRIGADHAFTIPKSPAFDFIDAADAKRWTLRLSEGKLPFWLADKRRRVPGTVWTDYVSILRLLWAGSDQTITGILDETAPVFTRLWHPLLLSALNTHPREASARLAGSILRGTLLKGGAACMPLVAEGLSATFIDPALHYLERHAGRVMFNKRLRHIGFENDRAATLDFADSTQASLPAEDTLICAVPSWNIETLIPGIEPPTATRAILNAHFRIAPPAGFPSIMGVIGATTEWIFSFPDRVSVTVSDADRLMHGERETLALQIWQELAAITGLGGPLPPWQIVKEKRATFAATPGQDRKRPPAQTRWKNLYLAGDWVQTGLPATIEGAIYSGRRAAEMSLKTR